MTFEPAALHTGLSNNQLVQPADILELASLFTGEVTGPTCFDDIMAQVKNPDTEIIKDFETETPVETGGVFPQVQIAIQSAAQTHLPVMMPIQFSLQFTHANQVSYKKEPLTTDNKTGSKTDQQAVKSTRSSASAPAITEQSLTVNTLKSIPQTIARSSQAVAQVLPESSTAQTSTLIPAHRQSQTDIKQKSLASTGEKSVNKNVVAVTEHQPAPVITRETISTPVIPAVKNPDMPEQVNAQKHVRVQNEPSDSPVKINTSIEKSTQKSFAVITTNLQTPQVNPESQQQDNQKTVSAVIDNSVAKTLQNEPQQPVIKVSAIPGSAEKIPTQQPVKNAQPVSEVLPSTVPATQPDKQIPVAVPASVSTQILTLISDVITDVVPEMQVSTISQPQSMPVKNNIRANVEFTENTPAVQVSNQVMLFQDTDTRQLSVLENEVIQQPISQNNYMQIAAATSLQAGVNINSKAPEKIIKNEILKMPVESSITVETVLPSQEDPVIEQILQPQTTVKNSQPVQVAQYKIAEIVTSDLHIQSKPTRLNPSLLIPSNEILHEYSASQINITQNTKSSDNTNVLNVVYDISQPVLPEKNSVIRPVYNDFTASVETEPVRNPVRQILEAQPQTPKLDIQTTVEAHDVIQRVIAPVSRPVHETPINKNETRFITQEKLPVVISASQTQEQQVPLTIHAEESVVEVKTQQIAQPLVQVEKNNAFNKSIEASQENIVQPDQQKNSAQIKFPAPIQSTVFMNEAQLQNQSTDNLSTPQKEVTQTFIKVSQQSHEALPVVKPQPVITHSSQSVAAIPIQSTEAVLPVQKTFVWPQVHTVIPASNSEIILSVTSQPVPAEIVQQINSTPEVIVNEISPVSMQVSEPAKNIFIPKIQQPQIASVEAQQQNNIATFIPVQNTLEPTIITRKLTQIAEQKSVGEEELIISLTGQSAPISTVRPMRPARQNSPSKPTAAGIDTPVAINNIQSQTTPAQADFTLPAQVQQQSDDNEISNQPVFSQAFNKMLNGAISPSIKPDMDMTPAVEIQPQKAQQLDPLLSTNQPVLIEVPSENNEIPSLRIELERGQASIELQHNQPVENLHWRAVEPQIRAGLQKHGFELHSFNSQFSGNGTTPQDTRQPSQETVFTQEHSTTTHDTVKTSQSNTRKGSAPKQSEGMDIFV